MAERLPLMFLLVSHLYISGVTSRNITIENKCDFTVWPGIQTKSAGSPFLASLVVSGFVLKKGQTREIDTPSAWKGRVWGRSRCSTNSTGSFSCQTGDCRSGKIDCFPNAGTPPATLAEFDFNDSQDLEDNYDVSVVEGYNLPLLIAPQDDLTCSSIGCMVLANQKRCTRVIGDVEEIICTTGAACDKFGLPERCCDSEGNYAATEKCQVTLDSQNVKSECPLASNLFKCTNAIGYIITFCPSRVPTK